MVSKKDQLKLVSEEIVEKWAPVLEGIDSEYDKRVTAQLLENQAKSFIAERLDEEAPFGGGAAVNTVGQLGTFQKFAFPLVRRVYPQLIANNIVGVQPMQGPVSQVFYLGNSRHSGQANENQTVYSKYNLTYAGLTTSSIFPSGNIDLDLCTSPAIQDIIGSGTDPNVLPGTEATYAGRPQYPSGTIGGQIAAWPERNKLFGFNVSAGERLAAGDIPEITFHIEQQPVAARTRKMRALWTMEASQDLRAYHGLDLERELSELLSNELRLEIDRELVEDIRMIAYDIAPGNTDTFGGFSRSMLDQANSNNFTFNPDMQFANQFTYDQSSMAANPKGTLTNVFFCDFSASASLFAPQHVGHIYSNLLATINFASQDIYKSTWRGPGNWILCAPIVASLLESAAKLEGGLPTAAGPTNMGQNITFKGKFAGKYDMYVDPMYPEDEVLVGYKGANAMDSGFVYAPYIPLQQLPTIVDPASFQPRKGIMTRYGKVAISPESRFYRIIRIVGPTSNFLNVPFSTLSKPRTDTATTWAFQG
jgi:hypothetical protein